MELIRLRESREVYGKHPDELSPEERMYLVDFVALRILEGEAIKKKMDEIGH